ncbi:CLUMA_CG008291, isoform A [Clunio marinus]|uniref:CLUMA_CG008291, isoform A n=1 Tax=Clunio marinus TaxID=568069 RepID=A0A1J1I3C6_9DIPT|nr:CLUMA_CG008291, isoform A [Clunio marinus]
MDKVKQENSAYKRIVPLKGNLLAKIREKLNGEKAKKEIEVDENELSLSINNNRELPTVSKVETPLKSPDKIIIQKVENVKIDVIHTTKLGRARRISSLFEEHPNGNESQIPKTETFAVPQNVLVQHPDARENENPEINEQPSSITFLSAVMPDNVCNTLVPLKLKRIIKKPKPPPAYRFQRVTIFRCKQSSYFPQPQPEFQIKIIYDEISNDGDELMTKPDASSTPQIISDSVSISESTLQPSTSKQFSENEKRKSGSRLSKIGWQDDILAVIGESRIREIDKDLKKIPNIVTGNAIETENVELKLILRHLLRHSKLNSIIETLTDRNEEKFTAEDSSNNGENHQVDNFDDNSFDPYSDESSLKELISDDQTSLDTQQNDDLSEIQLDNIEVSANELPKSPIVFNFDGNNEEIVQSPPSRKRKISSCSTESVKVVKRNTLNLERRKSSRSSVNVENSPKVVERNLSQEESQEKPSTNENISVLSDSSADGLPLSRMRSSKRRIIKDTDSDVSANETFDKSHEISKQNFNNLKSKKLINPINLKERKSSILIRNNYHKSPLKRGKTSEISFDSTIDNEKDLSARNVNEKRDKLKRSVTSKSNKFTEYFNDEEEIVKKEDKIVNNNKVEEKIVNTTNVKRPRGRPKKVIVVKEEKDEVEIVQVKKEIPEQPPEPLRKAIEHKVPYDMILQVISFTAPATKVGRIKSEELKERKKQLEEIRKTLKSLKYFQCGNCGKNVTKDLWIEHFLRHSGVAWIEGFEHPLSLDDWHESLRRLMNYFKFYKLESMQCRKCYQEKKSALGHLSHIILCGETQEKINRRMVTCEYCGEKMLPYYTSFHKNKCSGIERVKEEKIEVEVDDDKDGSRQDVTAEAFNSSGRLKRKSVKRAEKNFKKILGVLSNPSDELKIVNGEIKCQFCPNILFQSQDEAIEHVKKEHKASRIKNIYKEPQEMKNSYHLLKPSVEDFHYGIRKKTFLWTKEFVQLNLKVEQLPRIIPNFDLNSSSDITSTLKSLKFKTKSLKFAFSHDETYSLTYGKEYNNWKQLVIGEEADDNSSKTFYCGGSVTSIDWAPTNHEKNFLAVAVNNIESGIKLDLIEPLTSCVQLYEFENLRNEDFQRFNGIGKLNYVFVVNDGPICSIKFHPCETFAIEKRIGLLAVASANQSVLIYSLPYLNNDKSIVLPLVPNLICKLHEDDVLFKECFLMQTTRVAWHYTTISDENILAAGFVNGCVGLWNLNNFDSEDAIRTTIYPCNVIQAHHEPVTSLDFKSTKGRDYYLLTSSLDRKVKVYKINEMRIQEIDNHYASSRVLSAVWWLNWPSFLLSFDDSYSNAFPAVVNRQPLEFGSRNTTILPAVQSSIISLSINHWDNTVLLVSNSGDVFSNTMNQMLHHLHKKKPDSYDIRIQSSTDYSKIKSEENVGIVFQDFKCKIKHQKKYRQTPLDHLNEVQINQDCFNRNEKSHRFYALAYETGFIRVKYYKNLK